MGETGMEPVGLLLMCDTIMAFTRPGFDRDGLPMVLSIAPFGPGRVNNDLGTRRGFVVPHKDPEARRAYQRSWKAANRDHINAKERERKKAAPERQQEIRREFYDRNKNDPAWMELRNERTKAWRANNPEVSAAYRSRSDVRAKERMRSREFSRNHPEIYRAHRRVRHEIRMGRMERKENCEWCGASGRIEAAHRDYTKPLEVHWLCVSCHRSWDKAEPKGRR